MSGTSPQTIVVNGTSVTATKTQTGNTTVLTQTASSPTVLTDATAAQTAIYYDQVGALLTDTGFTVPSNETLSSVTISYTIDNTVLSLTAASGSGNVEQLTQANVQNVDTAGGTTPDAAAINSALLSQIIVSLGGSGQVLYRLSGTTNPASPVTLPADGSAVNLVGAPAQAPVTIADSTGGAVTAANPSAYNGSGFDSLNYFTDVLVQFNQSGSFVTTGSANTVSDATITYTFTCFLTGTNITTPNGETAVEDLQIGDLVLTTNDSALPVRWIGITTVSTRFADPLRGMPIRIRAGALANNVPKRDLLVSPDHAIFIDDILVHAGALVNGVSISRETDMPETFKYYHVELEDHSLIFAEGAPVETFVDNVDRMAFDNWAEHESLYGDYNPIAEMEYPRAQSARQVSRKIRALLAERQLYCGGETLVAA
jgi:Hint domain